MSKEKSILPLGASRSTPYHHAIYTSDNIVIGEINNQYVDFIVHRVNTYEKLVEALEAMVMAAELFHGIFKEKIEEGSALHIAKQALVLAKGETNKK